MTQRRCENEFKGKQSDEASSISKKPADRSLRAPLYKALLLLAFVVLGFLVYSNTLSSSFCFDDQQNIVLNPRIRLTTLALTDIASVALRARNPVRPVPYITFALNYYFHGYDPAGYHFINIIIHILTGIFLYLFVNCTLRSPFSKSTHKHRRLTAFLVAIIWLVHPIQVQSVTYIVQRMTSLTGMFYILSLFLYAHARLKSLEHKKSWPWLTACFVAGALALACKQIAATLPVFILLYEWYFFQNLKLAWIKRYYPYIVGVSLALALVAFWYLGLNSVEKILSGYERRPFTLTERLLTEARVVFLYAGLLLYPAPNRLNLDHDFPISHSLFQPFTTLPSIAAVIVLIVLALYITKNHRLLSFCILWFLGNLVIESSVIPLELVFEHRLYLPSMLAPLAIVLLFERYIKPKWARIAAFSILTLLCSIWTYERNKVWTDPVTLWTDCVGKSPKKARPHYNLGTALAFRGSFDQAIKHYTEALRIDPNYSEAYNNLGLALAKQGKLDQAITHFTKAIEVDPNLASAHNNLGTALSTQGKLDEAINCFKKAIQLDPEFSDAYSNLGTALMRSGNLDQAISHLATAVQLKPRSAQAHSNLAQALVRQGRTKQAAVHVRQVLQLKPSVPTMLKQLGWVLATTEYAQAQNTTDAIELAETACELTGYRDPEALDILAAAYAAAGSFRNAVVLANKAIELAHAAGRKTLAQEIRTRLQFYRAGRPYRRR